MLIPWRVSLNASTDSNRKTASSGRKSTHSRPHRKRLPRGAAALTSESTAARFVHVDSDHGYEILDSTTNINRKQRLILERRKDGTLAPDRLHVQAITAIANYQLSNRDDKFGYPMPPSATAPPAPMSSWSG